MFTALGSRRRRSRALLSALAAVVACVGVMAGVAVAHTFTLGVARHAKVTDTHHHVFHVAAVVNSRGFVVYTLTGDSRKHPECTSAMCLQFWPPVTVKSRAALSKAAGVKGKLGIWRHAHMLQVTLDGHPLYTFAPDKRGQAIGEGIVSFGGTWHVRLARGGGHVGSGSPSTTPGGGSGGW